MTRRDNGTDAVTLFVLAVIVLLIAACGDVTGPPEPKRTHQIIVCAPPDTVYVTIKGKPTFMVIQKCWP